MLQNPSDTTYSLPVHVTVEQSVLWRAGIAWLNASAAMLPPGSVVHGPPTEPPKKNDQAPPNPGGPKP